MKFYRCKAEDALYTEIEVFAWLTSAQAHGYHLEEVIEVYEDHAPMGGGMVPTLVRADTLEVLEEV